MRGGVINGTYGCIRMIEPGHPSNSWPRGACLGRAWGLSDSCRALMHWRQHMMGWPVPSAAWVHAAGLAGRAGQRRRALSACRLATAQLTAALRRFSTADCCTTSTILTHQSTVGPGMDDLPKATHSRVQAPTLFAKARSTEVAEVVEAAELRQLAAVEGAVVCGGQRRGHG